MRPQLRIIRAASKKSFGTLGVLLINGLPFCCTLEPPDRENASNVSSIPAGQYDCERYHSEKYPDTFQIKDVHDRTHVLFHAGNTKKDTAGCVVLGQYFGKLRGEWATLNSGNTFKSFMGFMGDAQAFDLTIVEVY